MIYDRSINRQRYRNFYIREKIESKHPQFYLSFLYQKIHFLTNILYNFHH
jgi:hypothetical protein